MTSFIDELPKFNDDALNFNGELRKTIVALREFNDDLPKSNLVLLNQIIERG